MAPHHSAFGGGSRQKEWTETPRPLESWVPKWARRQWAPATAIAAAGPHHCTTPCHYCPSGTATGATAEASTLAAGNHVSTCSDNHSPKTLEKCGGWKTRASDPSPLLPAGQATVGCAAETGNGNGNSQLVTQQMTCQSEGMRRRPPRRDHAEAASRAARTASMCFGKTPQQPPTISAPPEIHSATKSL